ncbi:MAG: ornithine cyclodeaminase [Candidatus Riflebacteria bacterium]|nr:ornithine cyclodeaminase [Candidatus Riflebacteria bacterium]
MKIITFQDIANLKIPPSVCYEWAERMIKNKHQTVLPPKISMKQSNGVFCNIMPSIIPGLSDTKWAGLKMVTRYPNRVPSLQSQILLMNAINGELLALMDGTWITAMRTGAVAAHSILLFGRKNFSTIGIMGLGNVVRSTLIILADKLPNRHLYIKLLKYKQQEEDLVLRFAKYKNLHFSFVDSPNEMVKESDIVISGATYLANDVCSDEYFDKGVLLLPIHTLGFTNCDLFFDKVFADDLEHVHHFKNFDKFKQFAEVCDVVNGNKTGRENDEERILVYNIGVSIHDINFAASIYKLMEDSGKLSSKIDVDLKEPTEKFWV